MASKVTVLKNLESTIREIYGVVGKKEEEVADRLGFVSDNFKTKLRNLQDTILLNEDYIINYWCFYQTLTIKCLKKNNKDNRKIEKLVKDYNNKVKGMPKDEC